MAKSLFEAYKNRLAVANTVYSKAHNGESMSNHRKLVTAKVLENTNRMLNEAFENSTGTQMRDMGLYKKFCLNLTTVALPNLISHDLVIVQPMSSMSGYITYIDYQFASDKGGITAGKSFANPFALGEMNDDRVNYTGATVVETVTKDGETKWNAAGCFAKNDAGEVVFMEGKVLKADGTTVAVADVKAGDDITYVYNNIIIPQNDLPMVKAEIKSIALVAKARRIAVNRYAA